MKKNLNAARQDIARTIRNANKRNLVEENDKSSTSKKKPRKSKITKRRDVKLKLNNNKKYPKNNYSVFNDE